MDTGLVLRTDGGPHPSDKWAEATAKRLFIINDDTAPQNRVLANKVQALLIEALEPHHAANQAEERIALSSGGDARLDAPIEPEERALAALEALKPILKGTPWEEKLANPDWHQAAANLIAGDLATAIQIERLWHVDRNPTPAGLAWKEKIHPKEVVN